MPLADAPGRGAGGGGAASPQPAGRQQRRPPRAVAAATTLPPARRSPQPSAAATGTAAQGRAGGGGRGGGGGGGCQSPPRRIRRVHQGRDRLGGRPCGRWRRAPGHHGVCAGPRVSRPLHDPPRMGEVDSSCPVEREMDQASRPGAFKRIFTTEKVIIRSADAPDSNTRGCPLWGGRTKCDQTPPRDRAGDLITGGVSSSDQKHRDLGQYMEFRTNWSIN